MDRNSPASHTRLQPPDLPNPSALPARAPDIVSMARAAQRDDRLATGALYGALADEIEGLRAALKLVRDHVAYVKAQAGPGSAFAARDLVMVDAAIAKATQAPASRGEAEDR